MSKVRVLIRFSERYTDFRFPEFESVVRLTGVECEYDIKTLDNVFMYATFNSMEDVKKVCARTILIRNVYRILGEGKTYEELLQNLNGHVNDFKQELEGKTFRLKVTCFGRNYKNNEQIERFNRLKDFELYNYLGKVDLKNPEVNISIIENIGYHKSKTDLPTNIYYGYLVAKGNRKDIVNFNLKIRPYIGTTSMDPELSLIMANIGECKKSSWMCDPFVGTGSLLISAAHFGSYVMGSDISNPALRGRDYYEQKRKGNTVVEKKEDEQKEEKPKDISLYKRKVQNKPNVNVQTNIDYYKLNNEYFGIIANDFANSALRIHPMFDCIVTDPPYGVREGARKIGKKNPTEKKEAVQKTTLDHVPQRVKYGVGDILKDLLLFAAKTLVINGKVVFWLPTLFPEDGSKDFPKEVMGCLELESNCLQVLCTSWGRRLVTMRKVREFDGSDEMEMNKTWKEKLDHFSEIVFRREKLEDIK